MIKSELESRNADVLKSKDTNEHPFQNVLRLTVAAKSIRTRAVSPCISSVTDRFSPACNSAKNWFRELKKNQRVEEMLGNVCEFFQIFPFNTLPFVDRSISIRTATVRP